MVEHIRKGTLDFVLLKPADAQFLVSTAKFEPWRVIDLAGALAIFVYAFRLLGRWPRPRSVALALVFLVLAIDGALLAVDPGGQRGVLGGEGRQPHLPVRLALRRRALADRVFRGVFRGALRFVFTFVFPLALMTTYPAQALLGKLAPSTAVVALAGGVVFAAVSRRCGSGRCGFTPRRARERRSPPTLE